MSDAEVAGISAAAIVAFILLLSLVAFILWLRNKEREKRDADMISKNIEETNNEPTKKENNYEQVKEQEDELGAQ